MQKTKFKIQGIKCGNCSLLIEERLKSKDGIAKVKIDQFSGRGVVIYDEQKTTEQDIYQAIESIDNFHLEKIKEQDIGIRKAKFKINGLKCNNCVLFIESRLKDNKGVVIYDEQKINESDIYKIIEEIGGFKVEKIEDSIKNAEESSDYDNPSESIEAKPPIVPSGLNGRGYLAIAVIAITIFTLISFGGKNNQGNQVNETIQNAPAQVKQQIDNNQQAQAAKAAEKNDNPILEAYVVSRCPFG